MKENLVELMEAEFGAQNIDIESYRFYRSIAGEEIELVFSGPDAFEKSDSNYWLPNQTWTEIREGCGNVE
jgi:hypothetical protein